MFDEFGSDAGHAGTLNAEVLDNELWQGARLRVDAALELAWGIASRDPNPSPTAEAAP